MLQKSLDGSFRLFRIWGIQVYLHWLWFLAAAWFVTGESKYSSVVWNIAEYVSLFGIVLFHEFGHALACRSVGGKADHIMLWPLGGVAFVDPPQRPGAVLWSIVAGPLVNVILIPITFGICHLIATSQSGLPFGHNAAQLVVMIRNINIAILIFNLLPIYPLDGGQIVQSILWFFLGRARSLSIATSIGLMAAVAGGLLALSYGHMWLVLMAVFAGWQSLRGYQAAKVIAAMEQQERDFEQRLREDLNRPM